MRNLCHPVVIGVLILSAASYARCEEPPKSPFARGKKLPGDLTDLLDGDANGKVSDKETQAAIAKFKQEANAPKKTDRGQKILGALDTNKDGKLDDAEAAGGAVAARMEQGGASAEVAQIFRRLDADNNGFITAEEYGKLQAIVALVNPEAVGQLREVFGALDANKDLAISFVESQLAADYFAENGGFGRPTVDPPAANNPKIQAFVDEMFRQRDRDEDGNISAVEAKRDASLRREFTAADASGDGKLTRDELYHYLEKKFAATP